MFIFQVAVNAESRKDLKAKTMREALPRGKPLGPLPFGVVAVKNSVSVLCPWSNLVISRRVHWIAGRSLHQ